jgi:cytochrome c oxidase subunit 2
MRRRMRFAAAGTGVALLIALLSLAACQSSVSSTSSSSEPGGSTSTAAASPGGSSTTSGGDLAVGRAVYVYGTDEAGQPIPRSGGLGMMGGGGCITCHGPDARGGTVTLMMSQFDAPDIRWSTLSQPMQSPEGGMEPPFDPTSFAQAVREGIGTDGGALEAPMPRWQLTDPQVNGLIAYLKTL